LTALDIRYTWFSPKEKGRKRTAKWGQKKKCLPRGGGGAPASEWRGARGKKQGKKKKGKKKNKKVF